MRGGGGEGERGKKNTHGEDVDGESFLDRWSPALRSGFFRLYLCGHLLSVIGGWMQEAALRWYVQTQLHGIRTELWLGITAAVAALPIVLFSPVGGAIADRYPRRRVITWTQVLGMAVAMVLGSLVWLDWLSLTAVLILAAMHGTFLALDIPARQSFTIEMVGRRDLASGIALNSTIFNIGRFLGPMAMGLVLLSPLGMSACFLLNAASFAPLILLLLFAYLPSDHVFEPTTSKRTGVSQLGGFQFIQSRPQTLWLLITLGCFLLAGGCYPTLLAALADNELRSGAVGYSALLAANGMGSVAGALLVAGLHRSTNRRTPIVTGIALVAVTLIGVYFTDRLWVACVLLFGAGAGYIMFLPSANSTIQLGIPDEIRGRVMSMWVLTFGAALPIGSVLAGAIASQIGTRSTMLLQGLGTIPVIALAIVALGLPESTEVDPLEIPPPNRDGDS